MEETHFKQVDSSDLSTKEMEKSLKLMREKLNEQVEKTCTVASEMRD